MGWEALFWQQRSFSRATPASIPPREETHCHVTVSQFVSCLPAGLGEVQAMANH